MSTLIVFCKYYYGYMHEFQRFSIIASSNENDTYKFSNQSYYSRGRNITNLLSMVKSSNRCGAKTIEEKRNLISSLVQDINVFSDHKGAYIPLEGSHNLLYSDAAGPSSGKIGPFVAKVVQTFKNNENYVNSLFLGPVEIESHAKKTIVNNDTIHVDFQEFVVKLFGYEVFSKEVFGSGEWKLVFAGVVNDGESKKFLRIMKAPDLFILEQPI